MELEEVINSIDIVEYIGQFVELEEKCGEWWGLSCFKSENTPSFSVKKDPPFWYDYSSGQGGNLFTFIKAYFNCTSAEAVQKIKEYAGIDGEITTPHEKMSATLVCKKYQKPKSTQKESKAKILPDNYMERYEKRADKLAIWENEGISRETLDKFQVYYDGFADRLVYPVRDLNGKIINVGGRATAPNWKEKGERKYCYYFSFGTINTLFALSDNMEAIQKAGEVIIFEGCKSVLLADTWGIHCTAAILTSHLSVNQLKILAKLGVKVTFALDKDVDITQDKNINKLKRYVNVSYIYDKDGLLDSKDSPVDKGLDVFKTLYLHRRRLR